MDNALIILRQIGIMFFYLAIGCLLFRFDLLTKEGSRSLANLLIYISLPCAIIQSFCVSDGPEIRQALLPSLFLGALLLLLSMAISAVLFHQEPLQNFGAAFSNAGFMGIPLISSSLGEQAVFFSAGFTAMLNILQWTYGQRLLSRQKTKRPWQALLNPLMIGFLIGLALFFSKVTLPSAVLSCLSALSGLNAPPCHDYRGGISCSDRFSRHGLYCPQLLGVCGSAGADPVNEHCAAFPVFGGLCFAALCAAHCGLCSHWSQCGCLRTAA